MIKELPMLFLAHAAPMARCHAALVLRSPAACLTPVGEMQR